MTGYDIITLLLALFFIAVVLGISGVLIQIRTELRKLRIIAEEFTGRHVFDEEVED